MSDEVLLSAAEAETLLAELVACQGRDGDGCPYVDEGAAPALVFLAAHDVHVCDRCAECCWHHDPTEWAEVPAAPTIRRLVASCRRAA